MLLNKSLLYVMLTGDIFSDPNLVPCLAWTSQELEEATLHSPTQLLNNQKRKV